MEIGFDTIGNATIICYDKLPVLVTDPWVAGSAYFGSWALTHTIPEEQCQAIKNAEYIWFSHAHPDHLNIESLPLFKQKPILLPNHIGGRIYSDLKEQGYNPQILPNKKWVRLSERIRVLCLATYLQDAVLLIDINGRLIVNSNDAEYRGLEGFVDKTARKYPISFRLAISGFGDADMHNFYDEDGRFIVTLADRSTASIGEGIAKATERLGIKYFIPFSSMHKYQRSDSVWANRHTASLDDYGKGFASESCEILPAYIRYDCKADNFEMINPLETPDTVFEPEQFSDNWKEVLEQEEVEAASRYFLAIEHLRTFLDFVNLRVGGKDNVIAIKSSHFQRGVTFECPRHSLVTAIQYEIFDDLLIGNFMKTTLHGNWPVSRLHPDFTTYVGRYADNGRAKTLDDLENYFRQYRRQFPVEHLRHTFEERGLRVIRSIFSSDSSTYRVAQKAYRAIKRATS
jgi:hypothetical protein